MYSTCNTYFILCLFYKKTKNWKNHAIIYPLFFNFGYPGIAKWERMVHKYTLYKKYCTAYFL